MSGRSNNAVPITMAVLLHVVLLGSMVAAFDFARPMPITPLAIQATLVSEIPEFVPPKVKEPEPEPVIDEPDPEPDNSEELRREEEEKKRLEDALIEKERLEKIRRQKEEEQKRKERERVEREQREEEEKERKRVEAERKRQEDIQRQREENERLRKELATALDAEEDRQAVVDSGALAVYMAQIQQKIVRNWSPPASAGDELHCSVRVRQLPGGDVVGVTILTCNGDDAVKRSVEAAIHKSSPLPEPSNPNLFDRNILLNLSIRQ